MAGGFFSWAAPIFDRFGDRWSAEDMAEMRAWLAPFVPHGGRILDVGGGTGALALKLADALDCSVTVLDPSPEMLAHVPRDPRVEPMLGEAQRVPFPDGTFDAAVISDAFHHFRDQDGAVRELARTVRPGGGVLVFELDPSGLMHLVVIGERLLGEPGAFMTPERLTDYFTERGIQGVCHRHGPVAYRFVGEVVAAGG